VVESIFTTTFRFRHEGISRAVSPVTPSITQPQHTYLHAHIKPSSLLLKTYKRNAQTKTGWSETLGLTLAEVKELAQGVAQLIHLCVYDNISDKVGHNPNVLLLPN
jgi:hypothetical protein